MSIVLRSARFSSASEILFASYSRLGSPRPTGNPLSGSHPLLLAPAFQGSSRSFCSALYPEQLGCLSSSAVCVLQVFAPRVVLQILDNAIQVRPCTHRQWLF